MKSEFLEVSSSSPLLMVLAFAREEGNYENADTKREGKGGPGHSLRSTKVRALFKNPKV